MDITQEMYDFVESKNWDEDTKQDVYVILLEKDEGYLGDVGMEKMVTAIYNFRLASYYRKEARRRELERENIQAIAQLHGTDDVHDPVEYLEAEELVERLEGLSPLLKKTLGQYIDGIPIEEMAAVDWTDENTIYQRIHQAKKEILNG